MRWSSTVVVSAIVMAATLPAMNRVRADEGSADPMFILGQSGRVESGKSVGSALVIGGDLVIEGKVRDVAAAIGGDVEVMPDGVVDGSVMAIGGTLVIDQAARVGGARVQVAGGDFSEVIAGLSQGRGETSALWLGPLLRVFQMLALFVLAAVLVFAAPRPVQAVRQTLLKQPARTMVAGLIILVGFVPLCILFALSLLGIPLIPLAVFLLLATFVMGLTAMAVAIGFSVPVVKDPSNLFGAMGMGMLFMTVLAVLPLLGGIVLFLASFYGAGAVALSRFGTRPPARGQEAMAEVAAEGTRVPATAEH